MGYRRTVYGVEYNVNADEMEKRSHLGTVVALLSLLAFVSLSWSLVVRFRTEGVVEENEASGSTAESAAAPVAVRHSTDVRLAPQPIIDRSAARSRPAAVRNLLEKLRVAQENGNVELAVGAIEELRGTHAQAIADLDDQLARKLSDYNLRRLFEDRNPKWVTQVTVRTGDTAGRIALEHGSTLASLLRLNGLSDANRITVGQRLYVLKSPRFILVVHKPQKLVDLALNGKLFRRYDLERCGCEKGSFELKGKVGQDLRQHEIVLPAAVMKELELLLPPKVTVNVSET